MEPDPYSRAKVYLSHPAPGHPWAAVFIGFGREEERLKWEYRYVSMPGCRWGGDYSEWYLDSAEEEVPEDGDEPPDFVWTTISAVAHDVAARLLREAYGGEEASPSLFEITDVTEVPGSFRLELAGADEQRVCQDALLQLRDSARIDAVREAIETALIWD